jgi:hypothetical protein
MFRRILCALGIHTWHYNGTVRGYANQKIFMRGCKRMQCNATQFKEDGGKWENQTKEKFREFLHGAVKHLSTFL